MESYRDGRQHLFDELGRLDLLLNVQIARQRRDPAYANFNEFRGLFISEEEIDLLADKAQCIPEVGSAEDEPEIQDLLATIEQREQEIARKTSLALEQEVYLPLVWLAHLFGLTPFDIDTLLVCVAPELDLKYEKLYAYMQNDVARKRPTVDLVLNLLCGSLDEKLQARTRLLDEAPLLRHNLITIANDRHGEHQSMLSRVLRVDDRILNYLLDVDVMDDQSMLFARRVAPATTLEALVLPAELEEVLVRMFALAINGAEYNGAGGAQLCFLHGPAGVGKKSAAEALCQSVGMQLLVADVPEMLSNGRPIEQSVAWLVREARLEVMAIYLDHFERLLVEDEKTAHAMKTYFKALEAFPGLVFAGSTQAWDASTYPQLGSFFKIAFPRPSHGLRLQLWQRFLKNGAYRVSPDIDLDDLAAKFNFTGGKIRDAVIEAAHLAIMRGQDDWEISADDLYQACRVQSASKLSTLARKVTPLYTWDDIVLPDDALQQLREVCAHARYRQQVFAEWGFDGKVSLGKGLSALFVGPSGTGKTMAAEIIAGELGLHLYKIDLSGVISKYIGETEKNLSRIFQEAEQSNAILFFDEADAIFGKRSEVKDSHDRYANIEINYLLQRIEEHEGITILASNLQRNIDHAFTRRLRFIIEFPLPDEAYRYRIWKNIFPPDTPREDDLDLGFLARQLKITGGNIRNIALNAAFAAAANSGVVNMEHIIRSTKREFQKMGRMCVKADFGPYFDWVREQ